MSDNDQIAVARALSEQRDSGLKDSSAAAGFLLLLARQEGSVDAKAAAKLYGGPGCSEETVREAARSGQVIVICDRNKKRHYPVWQFGSQGGTLPGLSETLAILAPRVRSDDLAAVTFFLNVSARLNGRSPLDALRVGDEELVKTVKRLAMESGE